MATTQQIGSTSTSSGDTALQPPPLPGFRPVRDVLDMYRSSYRSEFTGRQPEQRELAASAVPEVQAAAHQPAQHQLTEQGGSEEKNLRAAEAVSHEALAYDRSRQGTRWYVSQNKVQESEASWGERLRTDRQGFERLAALAVPRSMPAGSVYRSEVNREQAVSQRLRQPFHRGSTLHQVVASDTEERRQRLQQLRQQAVASRARVVRPAAGPALVVAKTVPVRLGDVPFPHVPVPEVEALAFPAHGSGPAPSGAQLGWGNRYATTSQQIGAHDLPPVRRCGPS